jgi:hypothetical protein
MEDFLNPKLAEFLLFLAEDLSSFLRQLLLLALLLLTYLLLLLSLPIFLQAMKVGSLSVLI